LAKLGCSLAPNAASMVEVRVNPRWMSVCNKAAPTTGLEAKFSYKHVIALHLAGYNTADLSVYSAELCRDPEVLRLRDCVHVYADETIGDSGACVTIDGRAQMFDLADPVSLELRRQKVHAKAAVLIGESAVGKLSLALERGSLDTFTSCFVQNTP